MRIIHVIETLNPRAGGPPAVAVQLSAAQAMSGHDVTLISHDGSLPDSFRWVPGVERVKLVAMPVERWGSYLTMPEGSKVLQAGIAGASVVHLHGVWEPVLWASARIARELGVPYVVRPAGMLDPWSLAQKWFKKRLALLLGLRTMLGEASFVHALNVDERDLISLLGLSCPIEVVPNGVFLDSLANVPAAGTFRARHPSVGSDPFVLFMARLHYKKGLDYLADAFQSIAGRLPNLRLVVAGPDGGAKGMFESRIARYGLTGRVLMAGELYGADKLAALRDATVFCLPSRQEGFSVAVVEALAMGVPAVITTGCHFPEVGDKNAGRVVGLDARAIGSAISQIVQDSSLAERMSESGRRMVRESYTWPVIAAECVRLYESHRPGAVRSGEGMRVLHVVPTLDPAAGGPPIIALKLATSQAALGHEVDMLTYTVPAAESDVKLILRQVRGAEKVKQRRIVPPTALESLTGRHAGMAMRSLAGRFDVVQLHGIWEPMLVAVARECRRAGVPYVVMPHGMLDPWSLSQKSMKKRFALALVTRRMLDRALFLHLGNRDELELIEPLKLTAPREIIPNGVSPEEVTDIPAPGAFRAAFPQLGDKPYILFLSRLHYKKGLDYLADAFALLAPRHADVQLVVAGPDGGARRDFEQRIAAAGLESRVHLVGPLYNELKSAAQVDAAVFCLPSRQEGFSIAIIEALAAGCPSVVSKPCHFPEVEEEGAGYVVDLVPQEIADALDRVLSNAARAKAMGQAGREYVLRKLTWPAISKVLIDAYRRNGAVVRSK
jgi:glycosyltransferase involved in cell wall biosynthesis